MHGSNSERLNETTQSSSNVTLISIVYEVLRFAKMTFGRLIPLTIFAIVIWILDEQYVGIRQVTLSYVSIVEKAQILIIAMIGLRLIEVGLEKLVNFSLPNEVRIQYTTLSLIATLVAMYLFVDLNQTLAVNTVYNGARMSIVSSFLTVIVVVYLITSLVLSWLKGKLLKQIDETMLVSATSIKYYKVGFSKIGVFK